jgi:fused signal recognition particle receptor
MFGFLKPKNKDAQQPPPAAPVAASAETAVAVPAAPVAPVEPKPSGWLARLKTGLTKTREKLGAQVAGLFGVGRKLDEAFYEELETVLLSADVGITATTHLIDALRAQARRELKPIEQPLDVGTHRPFVIMLAGVNGAGKTTSIGKLAHYYQGQGKKVLLAAGDTFRAAAREQLMVWGERNNVTVISQATGDSAAVMFDAMHAAVARDIDVVLADTAGRLPTQLHLMDEIKKVKRVIDKALPGAPHETLIVLDANNGQNALAQVKAFDDTLGVTGLVLTKLDGTAKGGVIAAIAHMRSGKAQPIPVRFIGVGEGLEDLRPFVARDFVDALLDQK